VLTGLKVSSLTTDAMTAASVAGVRPRSARVARTIPWFVAAVFVLLAVRLADFINRYTVNILYWDQWDFLQGLFDGADSWTLFRWQHGPQRQGLGNLILAILYPATGWNGRADAAASAFVMVLAALAGLWLVKRVCGRLRPWDIVVPLLFLTTSNAETYVVAPNLAHGPLPALLLVGYALALTITSHPRRCLAIVVVNFLCVNTGFTWLLGGITPALLLLLASCPDLTGRERSICGAGIVASIATVVFFFYGFTPQSATHCFEFPHARPWEYIPFAGFVLGRPFGLAAGDSGRQLLVGTLFVASMSAFVAYGVFRLVRTRDESALWMVATSLAGFTLLFAASSAVGRICLGFPSASATRYIPYVLPGFLAMYLVIRRCSSHSYIASALLPVLLVASVAKERDSLSAGEAETYLKYKDRWRECYLSTHDIDACDALAGHAVYPAPQQTNLKKKLDWLEERRLSLFRDVGR
jgi:hypothetical protein